MGAERAVDERLILQAAYADEEREQCERAAQTLCRVGIPLILAFAIFVFLRNPQVFALSLWLRLVTVAMYAVILAALHPSVGRRVPRPLTLACVSLAAALVMIMQLHAGTDVNQY